MSNANTTQNTDFFTKKQCNAIYAYHKKNYDYGDRSKQFFKYLYAVATDVDSDSKLYRHYSKIVREILDTIVFNKNYKPEDKKIAYSTLMTCAIEEFDKTMRSDKGGNDNATVQDTDDIPF